LENGELPYQIDWRLSTVTGLQKAIAEKADRLGMKPANVLKSCRLKGIFYATPVARHGHRLIMCEILETHRGFGGTH
jgi:hypothetical protein